MRAFASTLAITLATGLAVVGCAGVAPAPAPSPSPTGPPTADQRTAAAEALTVERQWLQSWFHDTPVRIVQRADGAVTVDVPREFCFEPGRSRMKPALAAVLDKVAESMRRAPVARLSLLAAPEDESGTLPLALQRANEAREHLRSRGIDASRLGKATASGVAAVQLRIEDAAP